MPRSLTTAPEIEPLTKSGKKASREDQANNQHSQTGTSSENSLVVPSAYACACISAYAPAPGEPCGNLFMIKIFSTNVGQDFQK